MIKLFEAILDFITNPLILFLILVSGAGALITWIKKKLR